ncbi:HDIG domain-containing protein [Candidatus Magnetoovum chiemensis]|nr:HDIG domain-containing protein [Candidatus Magnetoovum chiemensis]
MLIAILFMDIFRYKPKYIEQPKMLLLLGLLLFGNILLCRGIEYILLNFSKGIGSLHESSLMYGIPLQLGAMLAALLFDFHTAIIFSFVVSLLGGLWQGDAYYTFYVFTGSIIAAFSVIRCKKRNDIIKGGLYLTSVNLMSVLILSLLDETILTSHVMHFIIFAASTGITVSALVSLILPVVEYFFHVTTDITLLELLDLNQPLMKTLMINAPGTYHHSIIVSNLVGSVAEDIGVNPLLARVTCYYHDIGKVKMADYFIENQSGTINKHEKLTPHMSSMILISHVKEGLELAEKYKVPKPVRAGIAEHHGTNLITYFYQKAKEEHSDPPKEEDYRYPGPKPQTRITALIMIADAVEAASRVVKDPTPARVSGLVDKIVNNVLIDGQLDESDLTLKEINIIKQRFSFILTGILHKRIEYPGYDFNKDSSNSAPKEDNKNKDLHKEQHQKNKAPQPVYKISNEKALNLVRFTKS